MKCFEERFKVVKEGSVRQIYRVWKGGSHLVAWFDSFVIITPFLPNNNNNNIL